MKQMLLLLILATLLVSCKKDDTTVNPPGGNPPPVLGTWTAKAPMPVPTQETTPAVLNGKLYVVGGFKLQDNKVTPSTLVQVYDPASNSWSNAAPLPRAMHHIGLAPLNGKLYLLGGYTAVNADSAAYTPTSFAYVYDPVPNTWTALDTLPMARGSHIALPYQGKIYLFAGIDPANTGSLRNDIYDPATRTWSTGAPLPTPRQHVGGAVLDSLLYVISGGLEHDQSKNSQTATVEAYSPATNHWYTLTPLLLARHSPAVGVINGKIYVAGGETETVTDTDEGEVYDPATKTWKKITPIPTPRSHIGGGVIGNVFYVAGGATPPRTLNLGTTGVNDAFTP